MPAARLFALSSNMRRTIVRRQRLADAAGVTAHEIELQLTNLVRRNALVGECAEAGRDAIAHALRTHRVAHDLDTALHDLTRRGAQLRRRMIATAQNLEPQRFAVDGNGRGRHGAQFSRTRRRTATRRHLR